MRVLLPDPSDPGVDVDVHTLYARDWLRSGGVRVNFVSSADGAVAVAGRSAGLQTPGDNRVFAALRDLADVVVVGSGTARGEDYGAVRFSERRRAVRREYGLPDVVPVAVLSASLDLDPRSRLFTGGVRPLVLTAASADADRRRALAEVAEVVVCGDEVVDPVAVRRALEERGHRRILSEGGPAVLAGLVRAGVVDELCLSVSPLLAGPGPGRITAGQQWDTPVGLTLHTLLEEDGALFARYRLG